MNVTDLPTVVFKCKADYDSFKFEDRVITLDPNGAPVKIGRSQGLIQSCLYLIAYTIKRHLETPLKSSQFTCWKGGCF